MSRYYDLNGSLIAQNQPFAGPEHRGLRYGDGLFETMLLVDGCVPLFHLHETRLSESAQILGYKLESDFFNVLRLRIQTLINAQQSTNCGRLRLSIFRKGSGTYFPEQQDVDSLIEFIPVASGQLLQMAPHLIIDVYPHHRKPINTLGGLKTSNALLYILAGAWSREQQLSDAVILNEKGRICETVNSNLFIIKHDEIWTPPLSEGCLTGVMRAYVLNLIRALNVTVKEIPLEISALDTADEVFLTNGYWGIQPVMGYKRQRYFKKSGSSLMEALRQHIRNQVVKENEGL